MKKSRSWRPEGAWFDPIIERLEALENECNVFEDIGDGMAEDAPYWVAKTLLNGVTPFHKFLGLAKIEEGLHARRVGALVGCKVSLCLAMANTHTFFEMLSEKHLRRIEEAWGSEALADARSIWKRFAKEFKPRAEELRRFASDSANEQPVEEMIKYTMGYVSGIRFMVEVGKTFRKALKKELSKRERDASARSRVILFAVSNWKEIEANRQKLTWMGLTEQFDESTNHEVPIDEETFKKILQRATLTIGKFSRPMSKGRSRTKVEGGCP